MGIIATLIFIIILFYYLARYTIKLVRYLGKKASTKEEEVQLDIPDKVMEIVFPGGEDEINEAVNKLYEFLQKAHPKDLIKFVLIGSSVYFSHSEDKSEGKIIDYIQELSQSSFTAKEGKIMHDFIYSRALRVQYYQQVDESEFDNFLNDINDLTGCDEDEIPGASGAFGLELSNPIPLKGIVASEYHLDRIRTQEGRHIKWERISSQLPLHSDQPVDVYQIFDLRKRKLAKFYLSPYHKRVSNKAPAGFKLLSRAELRNEFSISQ